MIFHSDLRRRAASRLALPCPSSFTYDTLHRLGINFTYLWPPAPAHPLPKTLRVYANPKIQHRRSKAGTCIIPALAHPLLHQWSLSYSDWFQNSFIDSPSRKFAIKRSLKITPTHPIRRVAIACCAVKY